MDTMMIALMSEYDDDDDGGWWFVMGGDVDVDRSIVDLMGPEARASQIEMKVRSMRLTLEATVINGDSAVVTGAKLLRWNHFALAAGAFTGS